MPRELAPHIVIVLVCGFILFFAMALTPAEEGLPYLRLAKIPMPHSCMFNNLTGYPCPGCGLSRSIVSAVHGELADSLAFHRLGLITVFYIILQLLSGMTYITMPATRVRLNSARNILNRSFIILAVLFGINWIITLILCL